MTEQNYTNLQWRFYPIRNLGAWPRCEDVRSGDLAWDGSSVGPGAKSPAETKMLTYRGTEQISR